MRFTEKLYIKLDLKLQNIPPYILHEGLTGETTCHHVAVSTVLLDGGTCLAFKPDNEMEYLVGTEDGDIHLLVTPRPTRLLNAGLEWRCLESDLFFPRQGLQTVFGLLPGIHMR